ncbi:MAG: Fe-S cluster assembly protein IscX [candidate division Zixibacteria bacterium]|nr:Fe-S cluster assembly protein IscX [candidate division Zixibacteria bacterium]
MRWDDYEEIGIALYQAYPEIDPLSVRFTDLLRMVLSLPDFEGTEEGSNEARLEGIQMAWLEEFRDHQ